MSGMNVNITNVSCSGLRNRDGWRGTSDPFVVFRPMNVRPSARFESRPGSVRLPPQRNTLSPSWSDQVVMELGARRNAAQVGFPEMSVEVWDSDARTPGSRRDDLLGYALIKLEQQSVDNLELDLINGRGGTISLSYAVNEWPDPNDQGLQPDPSQPLSVRLYRISSNGLANTDGRSGTGDPYVKAHLNTGQLSAAGESLPGLQRLPTRSNTLSPDWGNSGELEFEIGRVGETVTLEIWDSDSRRPFSRLDDLLGFVRLPITAATAEQLTLPMEGQVMVNGTNSRGSATGSVTLSWNTVGWPSVDQEGALAAAEQQRTEQAAARAAEQEAAAKAEEARLAREAAVKEAAVKAAEEEAARLKAAEEQKAKAAAEEAAQKAADEAEAAKKAAEEAAEAEAKAAAEAEAEAKAAAEAEAKAAAELKAAEEQAAQQAAEQAAAAKAEAEAEAAAKAAEEEAARQAEAAAAAARAATEAAKVSQTKAGVVVRKELREMSRAEQERFVAALKRMMVNKDGPGTSEYSRIAGYHGWGPGEHIDYCHHGQETFPGWHRAYLVEMEKALQAADRENNNDGNIGLPYWDWSITTRRDTLPAIIREHFSELPDDLVPNEGLGTTLVRRGYSQVPNDRQLRRQFRGGTVIDQAEQCLLQTEHWLHASTRYRRGVSVEQPHNSVHVMCGFPMTSVRYAAFYPPFFLHHCNIDRLYSKYVQIEGVTNCRNEFRQQQARLRKQGRSNKDLYGAALTPFKHPTRGDDFMPEDTFVTESIGYEYDTLPPEPPQRMTAVPTFAVFENIFPLEMNHKSYALYVFAIERNEFNQQQSWQPSASVDEWLDQPEFAGTGAIFGGKGKECHNCVERDPYNVLVDISENLYKRALSRFDIVVKVMCCDEEGEISRLEDTPVPPPYLNGPFFESREHMAQHTDAAVTGADGGDVRAIQLWLEKHGWYTNQEGDKNIDAWYGDATEAAVKVFQEWAGLDVDGIAGPLTKAKMMQERMDPLADHHFDTDAKPTFTPGQTLRYAVAEPPAYLDLPRVLAEVEMAFSEWAKATNLSFVFSPDKVGSDIVIEWTDTSPDNLLPFGSHGGALAVAKKIEGINMIMMDEMERWMLYNQVNQEGHDEQGGTAFYMLPVIAHEIGHVLGLKHSSFEDDLMSPYYKAGTCYCLSNNDKARIAALYGEAKPGASEGENITPLDEQKVGPPKQASANSTNSTQPIAHQPDATAEEVQPKSCCCSTM